MKPNFSFPENTDSRWTGSLREPRSGERTSARLLPHLAPRGSHSSRFDSKQAVRKGLATLAIVRYERSPGDRLTRSPEGKPQAGCRIKDRDIDLSEVPELTENGSHQIQFALWTPTKFYPKIVVANRVFLLPPVAVFPSDHPLRNSLLNVPRHQW